MNGSVPSKILATKFDSLAHRLSKSSDRFFPTSTRRTVWNNSNLLDAGFFDALDLRAALIDGAGDGKFIDEPVGNHFSMVRLLIHVVIVIVGFADLLQNLLLIRIEHVGKRMRHDARNVGFHGIFSRRFIRDGAGNPQEPD